jgi:rhodanese-related sulfurtransferase
MNKRRLHPRVVDGIPELSVEELFNHLQDARDGRIKLIDVRRPDEFNNELGHIEGSTLITLGPDLDRFLENGNRADEIVFICRSGARSGTATSESMKLGYSLTVNLAGGMLRWNDRKFSISKK